MNGIGGAVSSLAPQKMATAEEKFALIRSVGEECTTEDELKNLISKKPVFNLYDGFEPSGRMHIAQGVYKVKFHYWMVECGTKGCHFRL